MIVLEFKARTKPSQSSAIDEAIRTGQLVRNKALRYWMENEKVGKHDLNKLCKRLAEEFPFAQKLNSMARQASAERAWSANCSNCGETVKKSLSVRTHICPSCGYAEDRDVNAAINILQLGRHRTVGHTETSTLGEIGPLAGLE